MSEKLLAQSANLFWQRPFLGLQLDRLDHPTAQCILVLDRTGVGLEFPGRATSLIQKAPDLPLSRR